MGQGVSFLNHSAGRFSDSYRQPAAASGSYLRHHEVLGKARCAGDDLRARACAPPGAAISCEAISDYPPDAAGGAGRRVPRGGLEALGARRLGPSMTI